MKLKSLSVKNFRGINGESNKVNFDNSDIIFLIGKNNTGKSSFLHAYEFYINPKSSALAEDFYNCNVSNNIEITSEFVVDAEVDVKDKSLEKADPDWISKWVNDDGVITIKKIWNAVGNIGQKYTFDPKNNFIEGGFGGFDTLLKKYAPTAIFINAITTTAELEKKINDIIMKDHLKKLETEYSDSYKEIVEKLNNLRSEICGAEEIGKLNNKMNSLFGRIFDDMELQIYSLPDEGVDISKTLKSGHGIKVMNTSGHCDSFEIDFKNNGHGVIRQILFSFLSTFEANVEGTKKEYLLLYEEPELYLHPEAIRTLRNQLYDLSSNSPYQLLCATHAPMIIDMSKPHCSLVRLVKNNDNSTTTYQVEFDMFDGEDKNYLQMTNRFNPYVCESFYASEVVLVEGDTEAIIYRELINRFYSDKSDVFVLNTGSKANFVFYQRVLTHFGIKHVVVHDVDLPTYEDRNGVEKTNAMWTSNNNIWDQLVVSNEIIPGISRRYVHNQNFESAHNYEYNTAKGKPLSAYEYACEIDSDSELPCMEFLRDLFGSASYNVEQSFLEENYAKQDFHDLLRLTVKGQHGQ